MHGERHDASADTERDKERDRLADTMGMLLQMQQKEAEDRARLDKRRLTLEESWLLHGVKLKRIKLEEKRAAAEGKRAANELFKALLQAGFSKEEATEKALS
ncbi:hypothetical protein HK101_009763 [Irineochytrium annulatum]|nr:hypothetical protein HK101_009763 [Irineochytrium annulatum]